MPEQRPAAQMSQEKQRWAFALPACHGCTVRAGESCAVKMLSCQPPATSSGQFWRSVRPALLWVRAACPAALEVSGAFSRAATSHLEWLLVLCASSPTPISFCSFLFPAQPWSQPSAPPCSLSTTLQSGLLQLSAAAVSTDLPMENLFPARVQWISSCAGVCRAQCVTQWVPHCLWWGCSTVPPACRTGLLPAWAMHCRALLLPLQQGCAVCRNCHSRHKKTQPYILKIQGFSIKAEFTCKTTTSLICSFGLTPRQTASEMCSYLRDNLLLFTKDGQIRVCVIILNP